MNPQTHLVDMAICCSLLFLTLLGFVSYFTGGLLRGDIDGLLLLSICFLIGSIFSALLFLILRSGSGVKLFALRRTKNAVAQASLENLRTAP
ncbi:MAG TPA: hypothetical protein VNO32_08035, partial [Candidatus Acidoferrum sp.]|nr:hypothetical protein [Candidatus Acidoferrum sp.]